ncbi:transposable element Tcb1 transposase [Trichonephila clavipes]|nr:transposable element Tcb1 transposase [Trichonephila clavipes]
MRSVCDNDPTILFTLLQERDLDNVWLRLEETTAHASSISMGILRAALHEILISLKENINWPARSSDLPPPDHFLQAYLQFLVFKGNHQMARIVRHNDESVREGYIRNGGKEVKLFTSALKAFQCNNHIVMAQRKHLDNFLLGRIIGRLECGRTQREVSEELGIAQCVISKLWQRFQGYAVTAKRNRRRTASDLSRQLSSATDTTVSRQTVYRRLGHIGLYARRPVRCVPLTATHCRL